MNDGSFEDELRRFEPRAAAPAIRDQIGSALRGPWERVPPSRWADRCLISAFSMGVAAALMIGTFLLLDARRPDAPGPVDTAAMAQQVQTQEYLAQLAGGRDVLPSPASRP